MNKCALTPCFVAYLLLLAISTFAQAEEKPRKPNFLVIVADDLGYSDIGAFGGEIDTPNLDKLALGGLRLASFYTTSACASTRAALMTGADHHAVGMGSVEFLFPQQRGKPGYELHLNREIPILAERLRDLGYSTLMSGKWHLGKVAGETPHDRGFSQSFALLDGGHNHWEAQPSLVQASYQEQGKAVQWPPGAYSSDHFTDRMIEYLESNDGANKPFFAYLAFTAPHWPIQAPADAIEQHQGRYDQGPEVIANKRLARQKAMGIVPPHAKAHPPETAVAWDQLPAGEKAVEARKMEVYAAMVARLDKNVGRVIEALERQGTLDNTYIIFLSDNGAEGMFGDYDGVWGFAGINPRFDQSQVDNSLNNLGRPGSFFAYGRQWAQVSEVPHRLFKSFATEGGIRNVAFVAGPDIAGGNISHALTHVTDIAPTLVSLAMGNGSAQSGKADSVFTGRNWTPLLQGKQEAVYLAGDSVGWELFGGSALRQGEWKITYVQQMDFTRNPGKWGEGHWQLYNLSTDPGETRDLSDQHPDVKQRLIASWAEYARDNGVVLLSPQTQLEAVDSPTGDSPTGE